MEKERKDYLLTIAHVAHEANRAWCEEMEDFSQPEWNDLSDEEKEEKLEAVEWRIINADAPIPAQHEQWMKEKQRNGWVYGEEKDVEAKTHPCLVDFAELPMEQKYKDHLFVGVVKALS